MGKAWHVILAKESCASASINADSMRYTHHVHLFSLRNTWKRRGGKSHK